MNTNRIPNRYIDLMAPTVRDMFIYWREFLYNRVIFNMPDSKIHAAPHCERVLYHALSIGHDIFGDNRTILLALAHAAAFHDTRRMDDYLDTGHGARGAVYYRQFCESNDDIEYLPEAALIMKYHDIDDSKSKVVIGKEYNGDVRTMLKLYDIFKDADALDRFRLGHRGLDTRYLRTASAINSVAVAKALVEVTMPSDLRRWISEKVEQSLSKNKLLLIVDPQVDFITGALPVPGARETMDNLAHYIAANGNAYAYKIVTADRHPYRHCSFSDCGGQWPRHCVHDTVGAAIWQPLVGPLYSIGGGVSVLYKGQDPDKEEYSIFANRQAKTRIKRIVESLSINLIDICGLAGDICVAATLRDGVDTFGNIFHLIPQFSPKFGGGSE